MRMQRNPKHWKECLVLRLLKPCNYGLKCDFSKLMRPEISKYSFFLHPPTPPPPKKKMIHI